LDFAARKRNVFSSPVKQQTMHNIGVAWDCKMKRKLIVSVTAKKTTTSQHNGVLWNMVCTITKKRKTIKQSKANCLVKICYIIHVYMHAWFQTLVLSAIRVSIILKQITTHFTDMCIPHFFLASERRSTVDVRNREKNAECTYQWNA
jgi:hypothetical protein